MKRLTLLVLFQMTSLLADGAGLTNRLAIYLVAERVSEDSIIHGTATPSDLKLASQPFISDRDLQAYNTTNHTFVITLAAAKRLTGALGSKLWVPFVVTANGERIYLGVLTTLVGSTSSGVPAIVADGADTRTSSPQITLRIDRGYPDDAFGRGADRRGDERIVSAVAQLFPDAKATPGKSVKP